MSAPEGYRYEWWASKGWTTDPAIIDGKRCRFAVARRACGKPAVAALNRSHSDYPRWWCYCDEPEHLYGRRISVDGIVESRRLVQEDGE